jgi:DNA-directed RNA polymerase specialized sigma24 family protein
MSMLIESVEMQTRLQWMIRSLVRLSFWHHGSDDLMQEALLHMWRQETECPGESPQWYLQSCRFHLQNFLRQGRSVDSLKRLRSQVVHRDQPVDGLDTFEREDPNGSLWDEVNVNDYMAQLSQWLTPQEKDTLRCLMDGLTARETARRLNVSHTLVNRHRSRIASLAVKLGITPSRTKPGQWPVES